MSAGADVLKRAATFRWRTTDARNITTEKGWVAIPREDYGTLHVLLTELRALRVVELGAEDDVNSHLVTAGKDADGAFVYPFLDCDELCADEPAGKFLLTLPATLLLPASLKEDETV